MEANKVLKKEGAEGFKPKGNRAVRCTKVKYDKKSLATFMAFANNGKNCKNYSPKKGVKNETNKDGK